LSADGSAVTGSHRIDSMDWSCSFLNRPKTPIAGLHSPHLVENQNSILAICGAWIGLIAWSELLEPSGSTRSLSIFTRHRNFEILDQASASAAEGFTVFRAPRCSFLSHLGLGELHWLEDFGHGTARFCFKGAAEKVTYHQDGIGS